MEKVFKRIMLLANENLKNVNLKYLDDKSYVDVGEGRGYIVCPNCKRRKGYVPIPMKIEGMVDKVMIMPCVCDCDVAEFEYEMERIHQQMVQLHSEPTSWEEKKSKKKFFGIKEVD